LDDLERPLGTPFQNAAFRPKDACILNACIFRTKVIFKH